MGSITEFHKNHENIIVPRILSFVNAAIANEFNHANPKTTQDQSFSFLDTENEPTNLHNLSQETLEDRELSSNHQTFTPTLKPKRNSSKSLYRRAWHVILGTAIFLVCICLGFILALQLPSF